MKRWYSAAEPNGPVGPADGQRPRTWLRKLPYPLSSPSQNGELTVSASSTGSHGWRRSTTATASSSEPDRDVDVAAAGELLGRGATEAAPTSRGSGGRR